MFQQVVILRENIFINKCYVITWIEISGIQDKRNRFMYVTRKEM